ncbi:MAG: hypothetical protein V4534_02560 [Myxococcota bacterium]
MSIQTSTLFAQSAPRFEWTLRQINWHQWLTKSANREALADQLDIPRAYLEAIYQSNSPGWLTERSYSKATVDAQGLKWISVSVNQNFCIGKENRTSPAPAEWAEEQILSINAMFTRLKIPIRLFKGDDLTEHGGVVMVQTENTGSLCSSSSATACSGYNPTEAISCEVYPFIPLWKKIFFPSLKEHLLEHEGGHTFAQEHTDKINALPKDPRMKASGSLHTVMYSEPTWVEQYFVAPVAILTRQNSEGERGPLDELQTLLYYGTTANITDLSPYQVLSPEAEIAKNAFFHAFLPEVASYSVGNFVSHLALSDRKILAATKVASFISRLFLMEPWKGMTNFVLGVAPSHVVQELSVPISHLTDMYYFPIRTVLDFRYYATSALFNIFFFELPGAVIGSWLGFGISKLLPTRWQRPSFSINRAWPPNLFATILANYQTRWDNCCPNCLWWLKTPLIGVLAADRVAAIWILMVKQRLGIPSLRWYRGTMPDTLNAPMEP